MKKETIKYMKNCKHKGKVICLKCGYNIAGLTMKEFNEIKKYFAEVDTADLCEVAHTITAEICRAKKIPLNCNSARSCGDKDNDHKDREMTHYSGKAQNIFNKYFDLLDNTFRN